MSDTKPAAARLEHVNISSSDCDRLADFLARLTGWTRRWEGPAMNDGRTIHLGDDRAYLAIYTHADTAGGFAKGTPMNHIGIVVMDIERAERLVEREGLTPFNQGQYDPGPRSFYFMDWDGIEFEIVAYE
jgi:catechol 2,3-dioxygenase-like lactoylglutathione lyase family enzyme